MLVKKMFAVLGLLVITACAAQANDLFRTNSIIYDKTQSPFSDYFDGRFKPVKTGEAKCNNYFYIVSLGDCSIKTAMEDAGITRINSIDRIDKSILFYHKVTILVHGE